MDLRCIRAGWVAVVVAAAARAQITELETRTVALGFSYSNEACVSADGRFVAFRSDSSVFVPGDTNGTPDIFVKDRTSGDIERVSVATGGAQSIGGICELPSISSDGRFVAFDSSSANLVAGDTNGATDVFLRDRQSGTTEVVSLSTGGVIGNSESYGPSVSADGRYVAFWSTASNLVAGDSNGVYDIFVRDRQAGTTERVSVATGGGEANGASYTPSISADGRFVAFSSDATNFVTGDTNGVRDIYVHDRQTHTTVRASLGLGGVGSNNSSYSPVGFSGDGRYVCFESDASNLVAGDANAKRDVFVRDLQTGTNVIASLGTGGVQGTGHSMSSAISSDGRHVVFASSAANLVAGDTNGVQDIFVRDLQAGTTIRASTATDGTQGDLAAGFLPGISGDGDVVVFSTNATNLFWNDTNGQQDVFARQVSTGVTAIMSVAPVTGGGGAPVVSADGSLVAFQSTAQSFVPGDSPGSSDVFVANRSTATIERVSRAVGGPDSDGSSFVPTMTPDGRFVAFASDATNLVPGDTNAKFDVFLKDRQTGTLERVSVATNGAQANGASGFYPPISVGFSLGISITPDGRYVAFGTVASSLDTTGLGDVCIRDRQTGTTEVVSLTSTGGVGNGGSYAPSISADGRYVAFLSFATNLVPGDTNGVADVFVRDRQAGTTQLVSVDSGGGFGNGTSGFPVLSADGRYVVFMSLASSLVPGDTNLVADHFVRDLQTGTTELASVSSAGALGNSDSSGPPSISADGRFVVFRSAASNLVAGDANGKTDIFLRDRMLKVTSLVSVSSTGAQGNDSSGYTADQTIPVSVSAGGRYVAFASFASNFVTYDASGSGDVFLRDRGAASAFVPFCFGDGTGAACPCANSGLSGHGCENSSTTGGAVLAGSGVASLSVDSVHLTASGEKPTATSVLLQGSLTVNSIHYGDGLRCVGGTLKRLYTHNAVAGVVTMPQGADATISARSAASGDVIALGSTRSYQIYYRDPSTTFCPTPSGSTFNITNAIAIAWGE